MPPININTWPPWSDCAASAHQSLILPIVLVLFIIVLGLWIRRTRRLRNESPAINPRWDPLMLDTELLNSHEKKLHFFNSIHAFLPPPPGSTASSSPTATGEALGLLTSGQIAAKAERGRERAQHPKRPEWHGYSYPLASPLQPESSEFTQEPEAEEIDKDGNTSSTPDASVEKKGDLPDRSSAATVNRQDSLVYFADPDLGGIWRRRVLEFQTS